MNNIDRLNEYKNESFDRIINNIIKGKIKSGKYTTLVKIKDKDLKQVKDNLRR